MRNYSSKYFIRFHFLKDLSTGPRDIDNPFFIFGSAKVSAVLIQTNLFRTFFPKLRLAPGIYHTELNAFPEICHPEIIIYWEHPRASPIFLCSFFIKPPPVTL